MPEPTMKTPVKVLYFGCIGETGHFLFDKDGKRHPHHIYQKPPFSMIDGGFLEAAGALDHMNGWVYVTRIGINWTILSFWDRTVDSRPGSNSNFIIPGYFSYDVATLMAQQAFPQVFSRLEAKGIHLTLAHYDGFTYPEANHGG
jgi:hypothetical protein